jgi:hypothetical protein
LGLMGGLPRHAQARALEWCDDEEVASVGVIVEAGCIESFITALGLKAGGVNETALRRRIAALG